MLDRATQATVLTFRARCTSGTAGRRLWQTAQGEPQASERADLDCRTKRRAVRVGADTSGRSEMVRSLLSPCSPIIHRITSSGLYLKENGMAPVSLL